MMHLILSQQEFHNDFRILEHENHVKCKTTHRFTMSGQSFLVPYVQVGGPDKVGAVRL